MDQDELSAAEEITIERLKEDLRRVVRDVEGLLRATAGQAGEKMGEARSRAEETLRGARARLADLESHARERAKTAGADADRYVHDNPWQAVGIAAGVAFLVGVLVSRR